MMSSRPGLRRSTASIVAAVAALCLTGAAAAPTGGQQDSTVCEVEFIAQSDVLYNPGLNLTGRIIKGRHNYSATTRSGSSTWTNSCAGFGSPRLRHVSRRFAPTACA